MYKFIMGMIIGYVVVVMYGPDVAYDIWYTTIELIREVVNKQ